MKSLPGPIGHPSGFTMVEIIAVLVLLGILAVAAISGTGPDADPYADREALKAYLRLAQARAMADVEPWTLNVDGDTATLDRDGNQVESFTFTTRINPADASTTFDNRGVPTGTLRYTVRGLTGASGRVDIASQTGFIP